MLLSFFVFFLFALWRPNDYSLIFNVHTTMMTICSIVFFFFLSSLHTYELNHCQSNSVHPLFCSSNAIKMQISHSLNVYFCFLILFLLFFSLPFFILQCVAKSSRCHNLYDKLLIQNSPLGFSFYFSITS